MSHCCSPTTQTTHSEVVKIKSLDSTKVEDGKIQILYTTDEKQKSDTSSYKQPSSPPNGKTQGV